MLDITRALAVEKRYLRLVILVRFAFSFASSAALQHVARFQLRRSSQAGPVLCPFGSAGLRPLPPLGVRTQLQLLPRDPGARPIIRLELDALALPRDLRDGNAEQQTRDAALGVRAEEEAPAVGVTLALGLAVRGRVRQ